MSALVPIVIEAPAVEPVTVEEARAHVEAQAYFDSDTDTIDDALMEIRITTAREACEDFLGLSLSLRTLEVGLEKFPSSRRQRDIGVELPFGPVRDVVAVAWGDESDDEMAGDEFVLDRYSVVHQVRPLAASWPVISGPGPIRIRYVAGYGNDSDLGDMPLPALFKQAVLLMVGFLFENRGDNTDGVAIPASVESLLRPKRVRLGMA